LKNWAASCLKTSLYPRKALNSLRTKNRKGLWQPNSIKTAKKNPDSGYLKKQPAHYFRQPESRTGFSPQKQRQTDIAG
jgi:hypothetical protein